MTTNVQEAYRILNIPDQKRESSLVHNNQNTKPIEQRKNVKSCKGKDQVMYKSRHIRKTPDFTMRDIKRPGQMLNRL